MKARWSLRTSGCGRTWERGGGRLFCLDFAGSRLPNGMRLRFPKCSRRRSQEAGRRFRKGSFPALLVVAKRPVRPLGAVVVGEAGRGLASVQAGRRDRQKESRGQARIGMGRSDDEMRAEPWEPISRNGRNLCSCGKGQGVAAPRTKSMQLRVLHFGSKSVSA